MIRGVGIDLVAIARMARALGNGRFALRVFTEAERGYAALHGARPEVYAGLFAAKEACAKALGTGFAGFSLTDIEVGHDEAGLPVAVLRGGAQARMRLLGGERVHLSITHERDYAAAVAVLEG